MAEEANRIEEGIAEGVKELAVEATELVEEVVEELSRLRDCASSKCGVLVAVVIHVMPRKMNPRWRPLSRRGGNDSVAFAQASQPHSFRAFTQLLVW